VDAYNPGGNLGKILIGVIVGNVIKISRQFTLFEGKRFRYGFSACLILAFNFFHRALWDFAMALRAFKLWLYFFLSLRPMALPRALPRRPSASETPISRASSLRNFFSSRLSFATITRFSCARCYQNS
jgi:hypothetical protein